MKVEFATTETASRAHEIFLQISKAFLPGSCTSAVLTAQFVLEENDVLLELSPSIGSSTAMGDNHVNVTHSLSAVDKTLVPGSDGTFPAAINRLKMIAFAYPLAPLLFYRPLLQHAYNVFGSPIYPLLSSDSRMPERLASKLRQCL